MARKHVKYIPKSELKGTCCGYSDSAVRVKYEPVSNGFAVACAIAAVIGILVVFLNKFCDCRK